MRMEYLHAMSDWRYHVSQGGKLKFDQFIRFHEMGEEVETDLLAVAKMFGAPIEVKHRGAK